jgi:hypothetical protein
VIKTCEVNPAHDGAWLFSEKDGLLHWNQDYFVSGNSTE